MGQEFIHGEASVLCDLSEKERRKIAVAVKRNCGCAPVPMPVLSVRTSLTHQLEAECSKYGGCFARLEDGMPSHGYGTVIV